MESKEVKKCKTIEKIKKKEGIKGLIYIFRRDPTKYLVNLCRLSYQILKKSILKKETELIIFFTKTHFMILTHCNLYLNHSILKNFVNGELMNWINIVNFENENVVTTVNDILTDAEFQYDEQQSIFYLISGFLKQCLETYLEKVYIFFN